MHHTYIYMHMQFSVVGQNVSWVLWCMHSHLLETGEQSGPGGLLVSTGHRVFNGSLLLFVLARSAQ